ncbi:MAG: DUF2089 domain-containing protein [gamma proteobacterium symbiont of Bathyaustriella thionipta]|nr:DUF2089 domain-containing protein [gamma proteobacterium symbiont of Bathyaustriella thionipta]
MRCPSCESNLQVSRYQCEACGLHLSGPFLSSRLSRLGVSHLQLAERFILAGGNLRTLAEEQAVSYPTLRKRLDELISALQALLHEDKALIENMLDKTERGELTAQQAARHIRELNGDA